MSETRYNNSHGGSQNHFRNPDIRLVANNRPGSAGSQAKDRYVRNSHSSQGRYSGGGHNMSGGTRTSKRGGSGQRRKAEGRTSIASRQRSYARPSGTRAASRAMPSARPATLPARGMVPAAQKMPVRAAGNGQSPAPLSRRQDAPAARAQESQNRLFQIYSLVLIVLFLIVFGLIMLYSTSSYEAGIAYNDPAYYFKRQLINSLIGIAVMFIVSMFPYRIWGKLAVPVYILSVLLILAIIPFGTEVNGARRWLRFGPVSVQPAEISKIAVILLTARLIYGKSPRELKRIPITLLVIAPAAAQTILIYRVTKNLSSALIVFIIALGMLFVARTDFMRFFLLAGAAAAGVAGWVYYAVHSDGTGLNFRSERLLAWLDPQKYADGKGFQTLQALYGIGSGGILGKGLGQSIQKLGYIPEAQNDMIFSIICEELGMFGAVSIIIMFVILCWCLMTIACNCKGQFGGMIASGVMIHIAIQVVLNIAVVTNTIPNTGVTLPFISYGGSSVIIMLAEIGIVLNIARGSSGSI